MRMFNDEGMDYPWRARWCTRTVSDGGTYTCDVNPVSGVNQPLDTDVEWFKASAWWYEPNLGASQNPADIDFRVCLDGSGCYTAQGSESQVKRLWLGSAASGETLELQLVGTDVPTSTETGYYFLQKKRYVHIGMYYEDRDRDDGNGPPAGVE